MADDIAVYLAAGSVAATFTKTLFAPLERANLVLAGQMKNPDVVSGRVARYEGIRNCLSRISSEEGFLALWKGNGVRMINQSPNQIANFCLHDVYKSVLPHQEYKKGFWRYFGYNFSAGALAGGTCITVLYPYEFGSSRLRADQLRGGSREFSSLYDCFLKICQRSGPLSLYRGFSMNLSTMMLYRGLYFGMYDSGKSACFADPDTANIFGRLLLAQGTTAWSSLAATPMDVVRRRVAADLLFSPRKRKYVGAWDCWRQILRNEGLKSVLPQGFSLLPRVLSGGMALVLYDEVKSFMG